MYKLLHGSPFWSAPEEWLASPLVIPPLLRMPDEDTFLGTECNTY